MAPISPTLSGGGGLQARSESIVQLLARYAPAKGSNTVNADPSVLSSRVVSASNILAREFADVGPLGARSEYGFTPRDLEERSVYVPPKSMTAGALVIFSLLGASIGLLVLWLFVLKGGFIWKKSDWEDYKSSVLRRPGERPDDAITVFTDGSTRRGGGSTQGARTVVLGELDTTYTKSHVAKNFGPRPMPKKKTGLASVWGAGGGSIWGRLRGGDRTSDADTEIQREKEMRHTGDSRSMTSIGSFIDKQEPARPPGWKPEDSDLSNHYPNLDHNETIIHRSSKSNHRSKSTARRKSSSPKKQPSREKSHRTAQAPPPRRVPSPDYTSSDTSDSSSDSETDSDDDSSINQSQLGMAKGNKVYAHPIIAGRSQAPIERNGGGAGGTFGSGVPVGHIVPIGSRAVVHGGSRTVMAPVGSGYRKGSEGSLSSQDSIGSSRA